MITLKKKIMFFNFFWLNGGVERFTTTNANNLCDEFEVHIAVKALPVSPFSGLDSRVNTVSFNSYSNWIEETLRYVSRESVELVLLNSGIDPDAVRLYKALHSKGIKIIVCNHEYYFYPMRHHFYDCGLSRTDIMGSAAACTFLTSFSERSYRCFNDNGVVMPNPLSYDISSEYMREEPAGVVAAVGRWDDPNKRVDRVLRAFAEVVKALPKARLILAGPIDLDMHVPKNSGETVSELVSRLALSDENIEMLGTVEDVEKVFGRADVSLLTSETEGFGLVLTEAQALGVPAVICGVPGLEDVITDGVNGYIVEQDDVDAMAQRVVRILTDKELYRSMRSASLKLARRFEQKTISDRWNRLINLILTADNSVEVKEGLKEFQSPLKFSTEETIQISAEYKELIEYLAKARTAGVLRSVFDYWRQNGFLATCQHCFEVLFSTIKQKETKGSR